MVKVLALQQQHRLHQLTPASRSNMVIGLIRPMGNKPAGSLSSGSWHGSNNTAQTSDSGSSKDPVVRLSRMLGQTSLVAEQQHSLKKCLEMAKADALAAFDRVGFLESLTVCLDEARALQRHQVRKRNVQVDGLLQTAHVRLPRRSAALIRRCMLTYSCWCSITASHRVVWPVTA